MVVLNRHPYWLFFFLGSSLILIFFGLECFLLAHQMNFINLQVPFKFRLDPRKGLELGVIILLFLVPETHEFAEFMGYLSELLLIVFGEDLLNSAEVVVWEVLIVQPDF